MRVSVWDVAGGVGGNTRGLGKATAPAAGPCTRPATVRTRVLSSTTRFPEVSPPAADGLSKTALNAGPPSPENPSAAGGDTSRNLVVLDNTNRKSPRPNSRHT